MKLWYKKPATNWNEALPIGNGHLGAMVFGGAVSEKLQLNDETIWYRGKADRNNPDSASHLAEIRQLLMDGEIEKAEDLVRLTMFATPRDQSHYETLGELFVEQRGIAEEDVSGYRRSLDISRAVAAVEFACDGVEYGREYYASLNTNAVFARFTASQPGALDLRITLGRRKRFNDGVVQVSDGIVMAGHAGGAHGVGFQVGCRLLECDGRVRVLGETIVVDGASSVSLCLTSCSDYWAAGGDAACEAKLEEYGRCSYAEELQKHVAAYKRQFDRVSLDLGSGSASEDVDVPTDERIDNLADGRSDPGLMQLAFDYGRYLLISSSQPGGLPANLQGIWCEDIDPIWGSKYTININTEMNYWLSGPCDLPETQLPLFDHLERMREPGRVTAQKMYGAKGFTCHHNTDGFGDTAPQSHAMGAAVWPMAVPWLLTHVWEHCNYFRDLRVLEEHYGMFKEAFSFYEDYLFEYRGYLTSGPSASPENKYRLPDGTEGNVCIAPTIDNQILRFFCDCCLDIAEILRDESDFAARVEAVRDRLAPTCVGKHGQIMEWLEDYDEVEPGHRHISPLFGLHPGNEIDVERTPELARAAARTIERRTSNNAYLDKSDRDGAIGDWKGAGLHASTRTGWSSAWLVHFNARLREGEACYEELMGMLRNSTLPNMFCDHPPFQIDGNFGFTSGLCEMLLQSQGGKIRLLPALPAELPTGSFAGLKVRGGQKVSASWKDGRLVSIEVEGTPGAAFVFETTRGVGTASSMETYRIDLDEEGCGSLTLS